ncbi:hypothetical protein [Falsirhodobacter sp. 20TX0035]|uniref:hypothetical protein n=1 Tax=Falsirhodobacter sp. 20TX0035 TaxID=3022019 RepID=UPI00232DE7A4|nr:hypothetical protein [Falsirhodobacter sp. 20TX0035]MDB6455022.1 hypothetical protein [Falsirhodobacter sp. 20TX0035]
MLDHLATKRFIGAALVSGVVALSLVILFREGIIDRVHGMVQVEGLRKDILINR